MIEKSKVIVGGSLESLLYAWRTQTPILIKDPHYVFRHDADLVGYDFSFIRARDPKELQKNLLFALSFTGLMICGARVENFRIDEDIINVYTSGNKTVPIKTEDIIKFDVPTGLYSVYDFFDVRQTSRHEVKKVVDDGDFVYQINFHRTPRTARGDHFDAIGASRMTQKQLLSPDYGQGIAMIKMIRMLKEAGVKGPFAMQKKGRRYYKRIKLDFFKREVCETLEAKYSFKEIYEMRQEEGEAWKTIETILRRKET